MRLFPTRNLTLCCSASWWDGGRTSQKVFGCRLWGFYLSVSLVLKRRNIEEFYLKPFRQRKESFVVFFSSQRRNFNLSFYYWYTKNREMMSSRRHLSLNIHLCLRLSLPFHYFSTFTHSFFWSWIKEWKNMRKIAKLFYSFIPSS